MPNSHDFPGRGDPEGGRLDGWLYDYVDRMNAGEMLDEEAIRREHPECAAELLAKLRLFEQLGTAFEEEVTLGTIGDFTLRRQIGRGGMGVVYEAWENSMDRRVALKVLPPGIAADDRAFQRFLREARTAGKLSHPNVVPVYATGIKEQTPYYAMEYIDGETVAEILVKIKDDEPGVATPFEKKDSLAYYSNIADAFADVADGLQHAHSRGVVHRDIKPSNLILDGEGRLRILDFGLALLEGQESLSATGEFVGTPLYMSPEQARRKKIPVDHRTDVYSLGATLYEVLTRQPPFRGKDHEDTLSQIIQRDPRLPRQLNPRVPRDLETIVLKCLRKDALDRYGTAEAVGQDLRRFVRGDPIEARADSRWKSRSRALRKHKKALMILVGFLLLSGVAGWLGHKRQLSELARLRAEYPKALLDATAPVWSRGLGFRPLPPSWQTRGTLAYLETDPVIRGTAWSLVEERQLVQVAKATEQLEDIAWRYPERRDTHYYLAQAYWILGQPVQALKELNRALEIDSEFLPARVLLDAISSKNGQETSQRTVDAVGSESSRPGDSWEKWWVEAYHAMEEWRWQDATTACDRLIDCVREEEPYVGLLIQAHMTRATANFWLKRYEQALADLAIVRFFTTRALEAELLTGMVYYLSGNAGLARQHFAGMITKDPKDSENEIVLWIIAAYRRLGDYEEALAWSSKLEDIGTRTRVQVWLFADRGQWPEALSAARRATKAEPECARAHNLLFHVLRRQLSTAQPWDEAQVLELLEVSERCVAYAEGEVDKKAAGASLQMARATARRYAEAVWKEDELNRSRTKFPTAIWAAVVAVSTAQGAFPCEVSESFLDGGDPFDCDPICWFVTPCCLGTYAATPGGLEVRNTSFYDTRLVSPFFTGDTVLRVTGSMNGTTNRSEVPWPGFVAAIRYDWFFRAGYYAVVSVDGRVRLIKFRDNILLDQRGHAGRSFETGDVEIELSAIGSRVELRVWDAADGETGRPEIPNVGFEDGEFTSGAVEIGAQVASGNPVIIRSVRIWNADCDTEFVRGDCNDDGGVDISDPVATLGYLFLGAAALPCLDAADADDSGELDVSDAIYSLNYLFVGGPTPPDPFGACGPDWTPDDLTCESFASCL